MNLLVDKIKTLYFKYLFNAFGSAMIVCIYSIVDMAVVGQYQGPSGTASLAIIAPIWNIVCSLGLLMGIGGSVLFSVSKGNNGVNSSKTSSEFFTTYYFQAIMRSKSAFLVSVLRGLVLSGLFILILPKFFGGRSIWWAMPITEGIVAILAIIMVCRYTRKMINYSFQFVNNSIQHL